MKIHLIAIHKQQNDIVGFRLLDSDSGEVKDYSYDAVKRVISTGIIIQGIELCKKTAKLKGSNGSLDRYPTIEKTSISGNKLIVLFSIDDVGYRLCNYKGEHTDSNCKSVALAANKVGIANGKVIKKDNNIYISAINGTYEKLPENVYSRLRTRQSNIEQNKKYAKELSNSKIFEDTRFPKVITGLTIENSQLKDFDEVSGMTVEEKLAYTILAMKVVRPFYYSVLSVLKRVEANKQDKIDTMGVSLDTLYFSSEFVKKTSLTDLLFIMLHEVCHIAMKHRKREGNKNHDSWNIACDYYINKELAEEFKLTNPGEVKLALEKKTINGREVQSGYKISLPESALYNEKIDIAIDTPESLYVEIENNDNSEENNKGSQGESSNESGNESSEKNSSNSSKNEQGNSSEGTEQESDSNNANELEDLANGKSKEMKKSNGKSTNNKNEDTSNENSGESKDSDKAQNESKGKDKKTGRLVGKELRGQKITDADIDMVDDPNTRNMSESQMDQLSNALLNRAVTLHKQSHKFGGDNADFIERYIEKELAPKVNWKTVLKSKLTLASQKINTFSAPDKRFRSRNMIMPGPKQLELDSLDNVKICVDTSGSISPKDLGQALTQVEQLFKVYKVKAELLYWDTRIRAIYPFTKVNELLNKKPLGGGGTDSNCIFEYFDTDRDYKIGKKKKPSVIIIFTDGYFSEVNTKYSKYKDTIWIVQGNSQFKAPFGTVAQLKIDN